MIDVFKEVEPTMQWCLDRAYKIAVHVRGITDWSAENQKTKEKVDEDTIKIAEIMMRYIATRLGVING